MSSSEDTMLDDLLAQRIVEPFSDGTVVTIPGYEHLSKAQQEEVLSRLRYARVAHLATKLTPSCPDLRLTARRELELEDKPALDVAALQSALTALSDRSPTPTTPPPDPPEVVLQEDIRMEAEARSTLLQDGCVPCYPAAFDLPLPDHVGTHQGVVSYFKRYGCFNSRILCSQLLDWEKFRRFQAKNRRYFLPRNTFPAFQEKVRNRRQRHKLEGDVSLHPDPEQQRPLDSWTEYQDYHLMIREGLERMIKRDEEKLALVQEEADGIRTPGSKMSHNLTVYPYRIDRDRSKRERHEGLLQWIEQQRLTMVAEQHRNEIATEDHDRPCDALQSVRKVSSLEIRTKKPKVVPVLSPASSRPSKTVPLSRNLRPRKRGKMRNADRVTPTGPSISRDPSSKSRPHRGSQRTHRSAALITKTRAGRIPKKPSKFGFG
ncbi:MAG: hypothetical protein Q9216_001994 [Gyalolechia sp. 2 TL-2023]